MHITNAPAGEKVAVGCDVTLQFEDVTHTIRQESYRITDRPEEHDPKNGILWQGSSWGEKLMGRSVEDVVILRAPEENIAEGTIISIDLN